MYTILGKKFNNLQETILYCKQLAFVTYRHSFPLYQNFSDDCGWGCTIRSFQMLLANLLLKKNFNVNLTDYFSDDSIYIFSIHNILKFAEKYDAYAGNWFSLSVTGKAIADLQKENLNEKKNINQANFNITYLKTKTQKIEFPSLVYFSTCLGVNNIQKKYYNDVIKAFQFKNCTGVVGGKKNSSFFFIGTNNVDRMLYFDPHSVVQHPTSRYTETQVNFLELSTADPCILFSWFIENREELDNIFKECSLLFENIPESSYKDDFTFVDIYVDNDHDCVLID